jgi:hypothetical protein
MAKDDKKRDYEKLDDIQKRTDAYIFGTDTNFERDNDLAISIINDTLRNIKRKYTDRTGDEGLVDYVRSRKFQSLFIKGAAEGTEKINNSETVINKDEFKDLMSGQGMQYLSNVILEDSNKTLAIRNYRAVYEHIPQAAQACDLFVNNITSPDDYNKTIFDVIYNDTSNKDRKSDVETKISRLIDKYDLGELSNEIIHNALIDSDVYVSIASIEDDIEYMLNKFDDNDVLTEEYLIEEVNEDAYSDGWTLTEAQKNAFEILYDKVDNEKDIILTEERIRQDIVDLVNERVTLIDNKYSRLDLLSAIQDTKNQALNESKDTTGFDPMAILKNNQNKKSGKNGQYHEDDDIIGLNGSSITILDTTKTIDININGKSFGYFVIEEDENKPEYTSRFQQKNYGSAIDSNNGKFNPSKFNDFSNVDKAKEELIKNVFIDTIAKKLNKDFLRHNKDFKDYIYELIKKKYITEKSIKIMYFRPDEVIPFHVPSIYSKVLFFVSLYIAMLSNEILIKMGRGHDKRVYYIESGLDGNFEQAIMSVIQDMKTKEFKLDSISDISTILNLNPGRFDDMFIPMSGGNRAMDIDTLAGMDSDLNSQFLEFLLNSILSGIGVPAALIDAVNNDVDFARTLSAQNGNFVRKVISYQKKLTKPFERIFRTLYRNEYRFTSDAEEAEDDRISIFNIEVKFPSPAFLHQNNILERADNAERISEQMAKALVPLSDIDEEERKIFELVKSRVFKKQMAGTDWAEYEEILKQSRKESIVDKELNKTVPGEDDEGYSNSSW